MSTIRISNLRRPLACMLIVQQLISGAGIPLPSPAAIGTHERFPCEQCGCGCRSAEQCWRHCCCMTNRQKVAWAKRNGVAVPPFVVTNAEREALAERPRTCPHCCHNKPLQVELSMPSTASEPTASKDRQPDGICWLSALRCHGALSFWRAAGSSWPGDRPVQSRVILLLSGNVLPQAFLKPRCLPPTPPTPPPRPS